jgi:O-antigen ligase
MPSELKKNITHASKLPIPEMNSRTKILSSRSFPRAGYRWLGNAVFSLAFVGFPLSASLSQLFGFEGSTLNISFRATYLGLAMILLLWTLARGTYRVDPLIGIFLFFYSMRIIYDYGYSPVPSIEEDALFYIVATLIPTLAIAGGRDWYDEGMTLKIILVIGGATGVLISYILLTTGINANANTSVDRATLEFLNPISIGYHGLFLAIAGLMLFARRPFASLRVLCSAATLLGIFLLVASGSRGPIVALVGAVLLTGAANHRTNVIYLFGGALILGWFIYSGIPDIFIERFRNLTYDPSALTRIYALQLAIDAALDNILAGYSYIEPITGIYPHNLLAEAAMALGLGGFILMGALQIALLKGAWKTARSGELFLPFVGTMMFVNAWISGSIWGSALFFMLTWLVRDPVRTGMAVQRTPIPSWY